jgi:hypothetical protein
MHNNQTMNDNQVVEYVNKIFRGYFGFLPRPPKTDKKDGSVLCSMQLHLGLRIPRFSIEVFHDIKTYKDFLYKIAENFAIVSHLRLMAFYEAIQKPLNYYEDEIPTIILDTEDDTEMISLDVSNLMFFVEVGDLLDKK